MTTNRLRRPSLRAVATLAGTCLLFLLFSLRSEAQNQYFTFSYTGPTVLTLTVNDDDDAFHERTITGFGARLTLLGEARVIDSFRGRVP